MAQPVQGEHCSGLREEDWDEAGELQTLNKPEKNHSYFFLYIYYSRKGGTLSRRRRGQGRRRRRYRTAGGTTLGGWGTRKERRGFATNSRQAEEKPIFFKL